MVLEIKVPHGSGLSDLKPVIPVFLSYVLSFIYIGIYWNNHHHMMATVKKVTGDVLWANLHLLFWLSLVPFTTGWMGENHFSAMPLALYDDAANGSALIVNPLPPMIAIPTTAGTGSEVGRSGVLTIQATNRKTVIFAPSLIPNVAILDPVLTVALPPRTTAATGMDALTHCIEAYCALGDHPMADAIALEGVALVAKHLHTAVQDGNDLAARGAMLKAAMMGAVAFQKGLGACHSLAHPLSAENGMHHGLANALCLPAVLDFNRGAVPLKIARIAGLLGARGEDKETLAFECAGAVRSRN